MTRRDATFELHAARTYPVVVLISAVDSRIIPALRFVSMLPFAEARALHISVDPEETRRIAHDWMELGLAWLPLHITEASNRGIAASVRAAVEPGPRDDTVTIVLPELDLPRWWHSFLHRQRARRIAAQLQAVPGITTVIIPFCLPADAIARRTGIALRQRS